MDSYELFFQLKHLNKYKVFTKKNIELIELLQNICDRSQFCDDIIMIFKRGKSEKNYKNYLENKKIKKDYNDYQSKYDTKPRESDKKLSK